MANYFTDRSVEYPGRYRLTPTDDPDTYDLSRQEGTIYSEGTPLNAENLNDALQTVIDLIPNQSAFLAVQGTTTYAEITAALNAGQVVFVAVTNSYGTVNIYPYSHATSDEYHFIKVSGATSAPSITQIVVDSSNNWTSASSAVSSNQFIIGGLKMCWGRVSLTTIAGNSYVDKSVTFPSTFSATPHVMCCQVSTSVASAYAAIEVVTSQESTSGATFRFYNNSGTSRVPIANWLAIGPA